MFCLQTGDQIMLVCVSRSVMSESLGPPWTPVDPPWTPVDPRGPPMDPRGPPWTPHGPPWTPPWTPVDQSQPPLSGNPEDRCHHWARLHPSPLCWSGVPTSKNVSISPLAARRPQAFMEPNLGSPPLCLLPPAHTHQCLWDQPPRAPLEHRICPECKLYSQGRLTCEQ